MKLSRKLIVESPSVLEEWDTLYGSKTELGATYVDSSRYNIRKSFDQRPYSIGYLGILRDRKGIPQFLESLGEITNAHPGLSVKIAGDGPLSNAVSATAAELDSVEYFGFIDNSEIVDFYNNLQLLVLPTESEGLPNVALEAMACGTPVLATAVGGLPDLITDEKNGFLMSNNSPGEIESNLSRALDSDLQAISECARDTVREKYTFEDAVRRYEQIITQ